MKIVIVGLGGIGGFIGGRLLSGMNTTPERCLSAAYQECPLVQARPESVMGQERCPHLSVEDVQSVIATSIRENYTPWG